MGATPIRETTWDTTRMYGPGWATTHELNDDLKVVPVGIKNRTVGPGSYDGAVGIDAMPYEFRLKDDDGHVCAVGICNEGALGEENNPLFDYGMGMYGCTLMEVRENGEWVAYIGG